MVGFGKKYRKMDCTEAPLQDLKTKRPVANKPRRSAVVDATADEIKISSMNDESEMS